MKNNKVFLLVVLNTFLLSACGEEVVKVAKNDGETVPPRMEQKSQCQPEEVAIEGYGDKGKRLTNCFVEYPGEPTRQDKSYYIVEDLCGQFTPDFVGNALGKTIIKTQEPNVSGLYNCSYYVDDKQYVMLVLEYLQAENQKKGHEMMGRRVMEELVIPMKNYVVYQEDGVINTIYFILGEDKFISIKRSITMTDDELLAFAAKIGESIKNYK